MTTRTGHTTLIILAQLYLVLLIFTRQNFLAPLYFLSFLFFFFFDTPHGIWDLSSPTRDPTHAPCCGSEES